MKVKMANFDVEYMFDDEISDEALVEDAMYQVYQTQADSTSHPHQNVIPIEDPCIHTYTETNSPKTYPEKETESVISSNMLAVQPSKGPHINNAVSEMDVNNKGAVGPGSVSNEGIDYGSDCSTIIYSEPEPTTLPDLDPFASHHVLSTSDQLPADAMSDSDSERSPKLRKKLQTIVCSDESSDEEEAVSTGHKKLPKLVYSEDSDTPTESNTKQNTGHENLRKIKLFPSEEDESDTERIPEDEVDQNLILTRDEKMNGRKRKRKRKQRQRQKAFKEVKKNWKDRCITEERSPFRRIKIPVSSNSSQELEDGLTDNVNHNDNGVVRDSGHEDTSLYNGQEDSNDIEQDDVTIDGESSYYSDDLYSDSSLDSFIEEEDSQADSFPIDQHFPQMRAMKFSMRQAFDHYLSVLVNGAVDPDLLKPENIKKNVDYEKLIEPCVRKVEEAISSKLKLSFSNAWTTDFREMLQTRSVMTQSHWSAGTQCEACQLQGRIASKLCQFSGQTYDRETLEMVEMEDDQRFIECNTEFRVGRFCGLRSHTYHPLYHFKFNTFKDCQKKVNDVKHICLDKDDQDIFDKCMNDTGWTDKLFSKLDLALRGANYYASDDKSVCGRLY